MNQIKEFCIIGLWGERNYHLKIRIEKDPEIQERELLGRRRYKRYSMCKLKKLKMEVSRIGKYLS